jgi:hypothetical protein
MVYNEKQKCMKPSLVAVIQVTTQELAVEDLPKPIKVDKVAA